MGTSCSNNKVAEDPGDIEAIPSTAIDSILPHLKGPDEKVSGKELLSIYKMITVVVADRDIPMDTMGNPKLVSELSYVEKFYAEKFEEAKRKSSRRGTVIGGQFSSRRREGEDGG